MNAVARRPRAGSARMRSRPRALVMRAPGTNCDRETVIALELAGAEVESVHLERMLASERDFDDLFTTNKPIIFARAAGPCSVSATASRRCSGLGCSGAAASLQMHRVTSNVAGSGCGDRITREVRSWTA